jgi:DNA adenine methylase
MNIETKLFNWIGGKKWLSSKLNQTFDDILTKNENIKYYIEPFCGSLGSLIGSIETLKNHNIEKIYLNDINTTVINTFNFVKTNPIELFERFKELEEEHIKLIPEKAFSLNKTKDKLILKPMMSSANDYYNQMRNRFNLTKGNHDQSFEHSALFLFLMNRSFNGIYRENRKGEFNSPYGWTNKKTNWENRKKSILDFHNFFNKMNIEFYNYDFETFLSKFKSIYNESLVYFDPPYLNLDIKENSYNKDFFGLNEQNVLLSYVSELKYVVYSNHDNPLFKDFFTEDKYKTDIIYRKNNMCSDNSKRSNDVAEILSYTK